jgi:hypothetical protein
MSIIHGAAHEVLGATNLPPTELVKDLALPKPKPKLKGKRRGDERTDMKSRKNEPLN